MQQRGQSDVKLSQMLSRNRLQRGEQLGLVGLGGTLEDYLSALVNGEQAATAVLGIATAIHQAALGQSCDDC